MASDVDAANLRIKLFAAVEGSPYAQAVWDVISPVVAERDAARREAIDWAERARAALGEVEHLRSFADAITDQRDALKATLDRARVEHERDDSNPRGPWCNTCLTVWPCRTLAALAPASAPESPQDARTAPAPARDPQEDA